MSSTEPPDTRTALPVPPGGPGPYVGAEETLRSVSLRGVTLSVRAPARVREGLPPALYVHGLGGSSQNWSALMSLLADRVDGEALDLPGFGDSPPPDDGNYSISGQARTVIRYLEHRGRGPVHLIGNSMGGAVATRVAAVRPDLVRTLTLVSPALPELRPQLSALPTGLLALPGVTGLFSRLTRDWTAERRTREVLALCYGDPGKATPEEVAAAVEETARRLELPYFWEVMERASRGIVSAYTIGGQHNLWRQAERVLAPTLLIYGGRDRLVSFRMARRAAAAFRGSRLLTIPEAGHVAMMEYPPTVARAVRELLDDTDHAASESPEGRTTPDTRGGAAPPEGGADGATGDTTADANRS
ncbi:alpha/beta fold hydrolase [Streptomyces niger]|uniref:alpha/beta fold hydrolase n=1 Tax=Streptomyces niger TaxID=66373 RepID=UPI000DA613C7|nr:alpha/beta hydrolase [Streptomyces niger]